MTRPPPALRLVSAAPSDGEPRIAGRSSDAGGIADDALVARMASGDEGALRALVVRHQARALGVARGVLRDAALAEDAVQAAFLDLHGARARYRPEGRFRSYLYLLVLNRCRMIARKQRALALLTFGLVHTAPPAERTPLDRALDDDDARAVRAAIDRLPRGKREVVVLRYTADLSLDEIARALDVPLGTVKSRLHAALVELRGALEGAR